MGPKDNSASSPMIQWPLATWSWQRMVRLIIKWINNKKEPNTVVHGTGRFDSVSCFVQVGNVSVARMKGAHA